jgi:uncharacterized protein (DUF2141 family)
MDWSGFLNFKKKSMKILIAFIASLFSLASYGQGSIEVVVTNIKALKGDVRIGLFNNEKDFLEKPIEGKVVKVTSDKAVVSFDGLPDGDYAVSIFHDENGNEELDKNGIGIPQEGFAFGNNAMGMFGPPSFEKAKVTIKGNSVRQEVVLKYF